MKIVRITVHKAPIRLTAPFITSLGPHSHAENVIVTIDTDSGLRGFGECSPFMTINGESMDTCYIVGQYLANALLGKNATDTEGNMIVMDRTIFGNSSIKSAFDIAMHDLVAQQAGLPLYRFLGGSARPLQTDYTISLADPDKMKADAALIRARGFRIMKVKLGGAADDDIRRMQMIRAEAGDDMTLRVDANQGWSADDAVRVLQAIHPLRIEHCEEPVARWNMQGLASVKAQSPIPVMADESCCDHHDAEKLIAANACDRFNIKLGKSSGFVKALQILKLGEKAGMPMQVGGFLESRLGFTASAHLALASPNVQFVDFDTPMMFAEDRVTGGITYGEAGTVVMPQANGLGAHIEEAWLSSLEKISIG